MYQEAIILQIRGKQKQTYSCRPPGSAFKAEEGVVEEKRRGEGEGDVPPPLWHLHIFVEFEVMGVPELRSFWRPATCRTLHCH